MRRYGFDNGCGTSMEYGIHFLGFPKFQIGREIVNSIEVSGMEGTLTERTGAYTDTVITNELEFACKSLSEYELKMSEIRNWLMQTKKVTYTDSEDRYYKVKRIEIDEESRVYGVFGNITVVFVCSPSIFFHDGDIAVDALSGNPVYNAFSVSHPTFKLYGEGLCTITVNGKSVTANVGQNLTIDTDLMIAYRDDGTLENIKIKGDYRNLYFENGRNMITFSSGFTVNITPKWRIRL